MRINDLARSPELRVQRFLGDIGAYARFECATTANGLHVYTYTPKRPMRYRHMQAEHPMLTMIVDGRARSRMRYAGREVEVEYEAGDLTCYGGGIDIVEASWQYDAASFVTIELDRSIWRDSAWPIPMDRPLPCRTRIRDRELARVVLALKDAAQHGQEIDRLYCDSLAAGIWLRLRGQPLPQPAAAEQPAAKPLPAKQLDTVLALMREKLGESLRLEHLAASIGMSTDHFARRFAASTGTTPHRYLIGLRVQRARRLLESSDLPLAQIAISCGFSSQAHLTATFRRLLGVTPARLRRGMQASAPRAATD
ncbi:MAG: helix-turn-helix domain-containing protein [Sutterellaceae bacterium]|nr:helix-turn-helix domain-containing protein [Burkholderiaceae bacterium]MDW8429361.1 helix-turn-helix domain-containing protein [Sutterellaceae bacterium]